MWPCSPQHDDMQLVRSVDAAHQRAHVGGGAGAGNENEIAREAFAVEHIGAKQITRLGHNRLGCDHRDLERRQQAHHGCAFLACIDTDRPGAGYGSERLSYSRVGVDHLIGIGISHDPRIAGDIAEQRNRQIMRRSIENAVGIAGYAQDGIAQSRRRTVDDLDRSNCVCRRSCELIEQRNLFCRMRHCKHCSNHRSLYLSGAKSTILDSLLRLLPPPYVVCKILKTKRRKDFFFPKYYIQRSYGQHLASKGVTGKLPKLEPFTPDFTDRNRRKSSQRLTFGLSDTKPLTPSVRGSPSGLSVKSVTTDCERSQRLRSQPSLGARDARRLDTVGSTELAHRFGEIVSHRAL